MKQNEFELINAINREGLDSSLWGLCGSDVNASAYDEKFDEMLPPHLYIYGDNDGVYGSELRKLLRDGYDRKLYYDATHYVAFFWLQM